jgi:undecaprenyl-diphosphatase
MEWLQTLDHNVIGWLQGHRTLALDGVMAGVTFFGERLVLLVIVVMTAAGLAVRGRRRTALRLAMAALFCWVLSETVKEGVQRPRPDFAGHPAAPMRFFHPGQPSFSFPSVHASGSASVYVTLALLLGTRWPRRRRALLVVGSLLLTGLIGISRVYLGYHYPTDVLAGWAMGLGFAFSCAALGGGMSLHS